MLQINFIDKNQDLVIAGLEKRGFKNAQQHIKKVLQLDSERKLLQKELEDNLQKSNQLAKEIGSLFSKGETQKANLLKEKTATFKEASKNLSGKLSNTSESLNTLLYDIPNVPHQLVPAGTSENDNEIVFESGSIPQLNDNALPHWELAKKYNLIDFELGNKITGAGFPVYKGKGAKLQRALVQYFLERNTAAGYLEVQPPLLVNEASGFGTGQLPDKEGQMYHVGNDNLYLIPTSEVPLTNLYRDTIVSEAELPIAMTAYTACFRREAGSYGSHVRGLNRLHQFDKVEIVRIEHPNNSYAALEAMVAHIKSLLDELELPYRILRLCGGDLGFTSAITYDFEVYSTAQKRWLEVSSVSNFETFQANRLKLRVKNKEGKKQLAHTLNGSAIALPRIIATLLENYQTAEGISMPNVLKPFTQFDEI